MLNVVAYTFELMAFIDVNDGRVTMYTRQTVLENLSPYNFGGIQGAGEEYYGLLYHQSY